MLHVPLLPFFRRQLWYAFVTLTPLAQVVPVTFMRVT